MFRNTELKVILNKNKYRNLIVIEVMVQMCIDATVKAALDLNFQVKLI